MTSLTPERILALAAELLGTDITADGYTTCPGAHLHTTATGARDFRLWCDPGRMPREHCFHASCAQARSEFMSALFSAIRREEKAPGATAAAPRPAVPIRPAAPPAQKISIPAPEPELTAATAAQCPPPPEGGAWDAAALTRRSPVRIPADPAAWAPLLLDTLYPPCSNILLFTSFTSQGDLLYQTGRGNSGLWQLGQRPGITPLRRRWADLPRSLPCGAWYLCAPVTGRWTPNPAKPHPRTGAPTPGRRHTACCTAFPYAVLESDTIAAETWLRILVQLREPIAAIYTSGGKSIHTLIRVNATTPAEFKTARARLLRLAAVGADPAAITPVRLTRLPGIIRAEKNTPGNLQRLLYLNPAPTAEPIHNRPFCASFRKP